MKKNKQVRIIGENVLTAISVGFVFVLIGVLFITTPNLFDETIDFLTSFELKEVPNSVIIFPGPENPSGHTVFYSALEQFSFAIAGFQIILLLLRFLFQSPWGKKAETAGNLVFWLGAGFLIRLLLLDIPTLWFEFLSLLLVVIGISLIARTVVWAGSRF